jgi:predicted small lipoprotein YifL
MTHNLLRLRRILEPALHRPFRSSIVLAASAFALLSLAGCGRKGPLDPPPGGYGLDRAVVRTPTSRRGTPQPADVERPVEKQDYDEQGRPVVPQGQKKPFILDPLIK